MHHPRRDGTERRAPIAVGAALDWELRALRRALERNAETVVPFGPRQWQTRIGSRAIVVYQTGVGLKSARRSTRELIARVHPTLIINSGCAGGLAASLRSGDLIAPSRIVGPEPAVEEWPTSPIVRRELIRIGTALARARSTDDAIATSRSPLLDRSAKTSLASQSGAIAVDMESSGVAEVAAAGNAHFASLRAILDPVHSATPNLQGLLDHGRLSPLRTVSGAIGSPRLGYQLLELAWRSHLASRSLRNAYDGIFAAIHSGSLSNL